MIPTALRLHCLGFVPASIPAPALANGWQTRALLSEPFKGRKARVSGASFNFELTVCDYVDATNIDTNNKRAVTLLGLPYSDERHVRVFEHSFLAC